MPFGVAAAAVTAYGAYRAQDMAGDAADAASQRSIAEQRRQYDLYRQDVGPYTNLGRSAADRLAALQAGDFSGFYESPDYQFALQQGQQGLERSQAARGMLDSGGASADLLRFGQGLASQQYGDFWNRLYNQATLGSNAAAQQGSQGMQMASNIGNLYGQAAAAQGQAAIGQANSLGNLAQNLTGLYGQYRAQNYQPQVTQQPQYGSSLFGTGQPQYDPNAAFGYGISGYGG